MNSAQSTVDRLKTLINSSNLLGDVQEKLGDNLLRIETSIKNNNFTPDVERELNYIDFICTLPWNNLVEDILDLNRARQILDKNHFGLKQIKERVLEYLAVMTLNRKKGNKTHQPILAFVGLVGSGKTSLAYSVAETLGRPIVRVPFGGLGSALQLRGESRVKPEAEPGLIMKALKRAKVKNPVILLDELDRVSDEGRNDIMGVLVELLDPEQNSQFIDHYVSSPFDLSGVLFIATANNTSNLSTAVLDRLEMIEMPFYTDEEKIIIAKNYLLPNSLKGSGLDIGVLTVEETVWGTIVRPLGFDGGIRSLSRNIDSIVRKIARKVVEGDNGPFNITNQNLSEYLQP